MRANRSPGEISTVPAPSARSHSTACAILGLNDGSLALTQNPDLAVEFYCELAIPWGEAFNHAVADESLLLAEFPATILLQHQQDTALASLGLQVSRGDSLEYLGIKSRWSA